MSQSTSSTSYVDLAGTGPAVTVAVPASGKVLVLLTVRVSFASGSARTGYMSFVSTGGTGDVLADDERAIAYRMQAGDALQVSGAYFVSGLDAGAHTFAARYRTSLDAVGFANRTITVIPMP
jgi:hypothetical protein